MAKQLFVMGALLVLMIGLRRLTAPTEAVEGVTLTLAAIGFVIIAAYTLAELGALMSLPKVTGYILAGIVFGPHLAELLASAGVPWVEILTHGVVEDMKMFNDLALGLIATSAGLELDARAIGRRWRTLTATVGFKLLLMPVLVGGTFVGVQTAFHILPLDSLPAVLGAATVFSALAVGTSPSISLAVLSETKAKGNLSDLTLSSAVLKDVVVIVCLALAIAITLAITTPGGTLDASVFVEVAGHLATEVVAGVALALFLILYIKFIGAEMLLFVAAMILVVAQLSVVLHVQPLLVFIVAGFVVRNFTRYEHKLLRPLEIVALPVFVVFFTNAGASVHLERAIDILPLALAVCVARGLAFFVAARLGARIGGERPIVQRRAWLAYLPLAGVTLGLVQIAANQLPEFYDVVFNFGMAMVAINLLVGPVTLRFALRAVGEIPTAEPERGDVAVAGDADVRADIVPRPFLDDEALREVHQQIEREVSEAMEGFIDDSVLPWVDTLRQRIDEMLPEDDLPMNAEALKRLGLLARSRPEDSSAREQAAGLRSMFDGLRLTMAQLPLVTRAIYGDRHFRGKPTDPLEVKVRRKLAWLGHVIGGRRGRRRVPVRMACRVTVEPRLAEAVRDALIQWCRTEAAILGELQQLSLGNREVAEARSGLHHLLETTAVHLRRDFERHVQLGLTDYARILDVAGSSELSFKEVRYSKVEPVVTRSLEELERSGRRWAPALQAAARTLELTARVELLQRRTRALAEEGFLRPLEELLNSIHPEISATAERMEEARRQFEELEELDTEQAQKLAAAFRKAFPQEAHVRIKKRRAEFKDDAKAARLTDALEGLVEDLPAEMQILASTGEALHLARTATEVQTIEVALRRICEEALLVELLPVVEERLREANAIVTVVNSQLREHVAVATFAVDTVIKGEVEEEAARALIADGIARSLRRIEEMAHTLGRVREETPAIVYESLAHAFTVIRSSAARGRVATVKRRTPLEVARQGISRALSGITGWFAEGRARLRAFVRRLRTSGLSQELKLRAGRARLDAAGLRELLHADLRPTKDDALPPIYARLFSLDPIHDRRLFAAHRNELKVLLREEHAAFDAGSDGVLVVGGHGSGRTSMLNLAQTEFRAARIIRLGHEQVRAGGFLMALAAELQCDPIPGDVRAGLASEPTSVLVDDLEQWFLPDTDGLQELERILDIVLTTRHVAFWAMTMSEDALSIVDPIFALRQAFGRVINLGALDADALAHVIETRNKVSGLAIEYPRIRFAGLFGDRQDEANRQAYYRNLARTSRGNLQAALRVWHRDIELGEGDVVRPRLRSNVLTGPRFLSQLHPHAVAIVVQGMRFGVVEVEHLRRTLGISRGEINRHLAFLRAAGILQRRSAFSGGLRISPAVQPTIVDTLSDAGALRRST